MLTAVKSRSLIVAPASLLVSLMTVLALWASPAAAATDASQAEGEPVGVDALLEQDPEVVEAAKVRARNIDIYTTDSGTRGGHFHGTLTWRGNGPYSGQLTGEVSDREADGHCAVVSVSLDGSSYNLLKNRACPAPETQYVSFSYPNAREGIPRAHIVKVRVCLYNTKDKMLRHCSAWR